jgi:hypothetical protein
MLEVSGPSRAFLVDDDALTLVVLIEVPLIASYLKMLPVNMRIRRLPAA